jgi:hypothetical protein
MQGALGRGSVVALLGVVVAASCSSSDHDFAEGKGGTGGGGSSGLTGASGEPAAAGGNEGGNAGSGATKPIGGGGAPIEGGAGGENPSVLSVVSISPNDATTAVERTVPIEVTFSAPVDAKSVVAASFSVVGPAGAVLGKLSIDGAKATFTPDAPWSLLADYTVKLSKAIAAVDASPIDGAHTYTFETRDGVFGKAVRLSTTGGVNLSMTGNRAGHAAVFWQTDEATSTVEAAIYDPNAAKWGPATKLEADDVNTYTSPRLALNEKGEAFANFYGPANALTWNRFTAGKWGSAKLEPARTVGSGALADDGTAMLIWAATAGAGYDLVAASLSPANKWSATATIQAKATTWGIQRYGAGFMAFQTRQPGGEVYSNIVDPKTGWGAAKPISTTSTNYVFFDANGAAAVFVYNDPKGRIRAAVYDGTAWATTDLGPVAGGTCASAGSNGHLAAWLYQKNAYAARYDLKTGWADPIKLGATNAEDFGPAASVDASGNALAAWPNGSTIDWRRSVAGSADWSDVQQIKDQDPGIVYSRVDSAGDVMIVWSNPLGIWASRFE